MYNFTCRMTAFELFEGWVARLGLLLMSWMEILIMVPGFFRPLLVTIEVVGSLSLNGGLLKFLGLKIHGILKCFSCKFYLLLSGFAPHEILRERRMERDILNWKTEEPQHGLEECPAVRVLSGP